MNKKMNSNTSVLIQERGQPVWTVSKNLTIFSLTTLFWAIVLNEQWQINNPYKKKPKS